MLDRIVEWLRGEETTDFGLPADPRERAEAVRDRSGTLHRGTEDEQVVNYALDDESPLVRAAALDVLKSDSVYARDLSPEPLLYLLEEEDATVRLKAVELFGSDHLLAKRTPAAPVIDLLDDEDRLVRLAAARFFEGTIRNDGLDRIYDLVFADDVGVRAAGAMALANGIQGAPYELSQEQVHELVDVLDETAREAEQSEDQALAREYILDVLSRGSFVSGLGFLGDSQTAIITGELDADTPQIRANATTVLGYIEHDSVLDPLIDALEDDSPTVRIHAMRALERAGTTTGSHMDRVETLSEGALSSDIQADERVTRALEATLNRETDPEALDQCLKSLGKLGDPNVVASIVSHLDSDDEGRRQSVVNALGDLAPVAVEPLTDCLRNDPSEDVRKTAANGLSDPNVDAFDALRRAYETDESDQVRASAVSAMNTSDADVAVDVALDALNDEAVTVRNKAAFTLGELGAPVAADVLRSAAETDPNPNVREKAKRALDKL